MSVQLLAVLANAGLMVMKFTIGHFSHSRALVADGFNSAGDILATFVAWLAFRYARTPPDQNHPFGHGNAESLAGLLIGALLLGTGAFICLEGLDAWLAQHSDAPQVPEPPALVAAGITIAVKLGLLVLSLQVGRRTNSPTLLASARDHQADVVIGVVALVGIFLARNGLPWIDAASGIAIGVYVFWLGFAPVRDNLDVLMQREPPEIGDRARHAALEVDGAVAVRSVRVAPIGGEYRIELTLQVDGSHTVARGHELAHAAEDRILATIDHVQAVVVHVEPA